MDRLPTYRDIMEKLTEAGYLAYLVGGAVRDAYLDRPISDYDITTDATPDEVLAVFPEGTFINATFAVSVMVPSAEVSGFVEISTMREEDDSLYKNGKPTDFKFTDNLLLDLSRRDATINAMALDSDGNLVDPFNGKRHLQEKRVIAVGDPVKRIRAHPIRMMRYIRMARCLGEGWSMDTVLANAIIANAKYIVLESWEAIGKEFFKGLSCPSPDKYLKALKHTGILQIIMPEIVYSFDTKQNKFHNFNTVWEHTMLAVRSGAFLEQTALASFATLLHDIGKPAVVEYKNPTYGNSFYGHESDGAVIANMICKRFRLSNRERKLVVLAVRHHMFHIDNLVQARKFLRKLDSGENNALEEIVERSSFVMSVKRADALGRDDSVSMVKRMQNERAFLELAIEEEAAVTVKDLAVNGHDIMNRLGIEPGVMVGRILNNLLDLVTSDKVENRREPLLDVAARVYLESTVAV